MRKQDLRNQVEEYIESVGSDPRKFAVDYAVIEIADQMEDSDFSLEKAIVDILRDDTLTDQAIKDQIFSYVGDGGWDASDWDIDGAVKYIWEHINPLQDVTSELLDDALEKNPSKK